MEQEDTCSQHGRDRGVIINDYKQVLAGLRLAAPRVEKTRMSKFNETTASFERSMPVAYRAKYSGREIAAHADIAARRGGAVEVGVCGRRGALTSVCIIAENRSDLLCLISEAFVACSIDVVEAEGFSRTLPDAPKKAEAVNLFGLRRSSGEPIDSGDIKRLNDVLLRLLDGTWVRTAGSGDSETSPKSTQPEPENRPVTRVRFIENGSGALCTLEVETDDRSGLLLSLSRALTSQHVQIVRSEVKTIQRRVVDRFTITELDGSPVGDERRLAIQVAVLSAAEPAKRLSTPAPPQADSIFG